jgi:hypothetical protein
VSASSTTVDFLVRDTRQAGHFWADNEILDVYGARLGAHGIAVYMAMCRRADNRTGETRLSTARIAELVSMSKGGVFNALSLIVSLGLAHKLIDSNGPIPAVYVLADVKAKSVHHMNGNRSSGERTVHPVNAQYGRQDSFKTKPIPPPPLFQRGDITKRDIRKICTEVQKRRPGWMGADDYTKDMHIDRICRSCGVDADHFREQVGWPRSPRPAWYDDEPAMEEAPCS